MSDHPQLHPRSQRNETWSVRVPTLARLLRTVGRGCTGGFIATVVMTVYRIPVFRALPPTAEFWARYIGGGDAEEYIVPGLFLHFVYGTAAGGTYGFIVSFLDVRNPILRERVNLLGSDTDSLSRPSDLALSLCASSVES